MLSSELRSVIERHSIVEVLQQLGFEAPARWNGSSDFMISCPSPWHEDSTPSCIVHTQSDRYYCFGCGAHGDVLQLVRDVVGTRSLRDAADILERGAVRPVAPSTTPPSRVAPAGDIDPTRTTLDRVMAVNEAAWSELTSPAAVRIATGYLRVRGLHVGRLDGLLVRPFVGYPPAGGDGLVTRLRGQGFTEAELIDAGWAVRSPIGHVRDRFRRRVLFPYVNDRGQLLGVVGRDVTGNARQKYLNSPTTAAFQKSAVLYEPARVVADQETVTICEGPLDALAVIASPANLGLASRRAVAASGTALTEAHVRVLTTAGVRHAVLLPDSDGPGEVARSAWHETCAAAGLATSDCRAPRALDPAGWLTPVPGELAVMSRPGGQTADRW